MPFVTKSTPSYLITSGAKLRMKRRFIGLIGKKLCKDKKKGGMGFWDISAFNLAMLAKQARRLIHNEQSPFYGVYKVRYFPNSSFLMAELGSNPSAVWRSLLAAREVLSEGSTWQIRDGSSIGVTTHKWLPNAPAFLHEPNAEMKVCELIDQS